jgi:hypothetical protein
MWHGPKRFSFNFSCLHAAINQPFCSPLTYMPVSHATCELFRTTQYGNSGFLALIASVPNMHVWSLKRDIMHFSYCYAAIGGIGRYIMLLWRMKSLNSQLQIRAVRNKIYGKVYWYLLWKADKIWIKYNTWQCFRCQEIQRKREIPSDINLKLIL